MGHSVRRHLRVEVEAYDAAIRTFIPDYEEMLDEAAAALAEVKPGRVLDLGAGTGGLAAVLLRHPEIGHVELLDVDPEMQEQSRARLADAGERVSFTLRSFDGALPICDAVAASLSLHHIPTLTAKEALWRRVYAALPAGGLAVNADAVIPADGSASRAVYRGWAAHMVAEGITEEQAWKHFEEWSEEDTYFPLEDELATLTRAGFDATCRWHRGPVSVVVGRKP